MTTPCTLSLVVPCYNEETTLAGCVERILAVQTEDMKIEIIIVDDCSTDNSRAVAEDLVKRHPQIRFITHDVNLGKGAALRTGFVHATGDYVGIQDADMEYDPQQYKILLKPLQDGRAEVVYGSRYLRPGTRRVLYFWHTWMNKTLTFVSNMFTNLDISDMETCYKLFRREVIQEIAPLLKENRFGFEPEVTALIATHPWQGRPLRLWECAITYNPRSYEEGKKIGWRDGVRALYCILHYSAHKAPLPMQLLLYLFIGGSSAVANIVLFSLFMATGLGLNVSTLTAFLVAAVINYLLCIAILFRHRARWNTFGELVAYAVTLVIMGAVDYGLTVGLVALSSSPFWSKVTATIIGFFGNFLLRKYMVFPEKTKR